MSDPIKEEARKLFARYNFLREKDRKGKDGKGKEREKGQLSPKYNPAQAPCEKLCEAKGELAHQRFINELQAQNLHEEIERRQKLQDALNKLKENERRLVGVLALFSLTQTFSLIIVLALLVP